MSAEVEPWTCAMHGITTMGDCPRCDDDLLAGEGGAEPTPVAAVTDALNYARTYWQHGHEPRTQQALAVLAARVQQAEAERDAAEAQRRDWRSKAFALQDKVERVEALATEWDALSKGETGTTRRLRAALDGHR